MHVSRWIVGALLTVVPLGVASRASAGDGAAAEVRRIRTHFDSVLTELGARDVRSLSPEQRARRAEVTKTLSAYRARGVFPHNYDFPGQAIPYFVDRKTRTLCAVAHLLESTGGRDIVDRVAKTNNNVWVAELAGDTAFGRWLDDNGLTLAEAARIQVPYVAPESPAERVRNVTFLAVAPVALSGAAITSVWNAFGNADGHRTGVSWTGMVSGGLAVGTGALLMTMTKGSVTPVASIAGATSMMVGGVSMLVSGRAISRHRAFVSAEEARKRSVAIAPTVSGTGGAGVAVSLRF
jgi:hypothetical protein